MCRNISKLTSTSSKSLARAQIVDAETTGLKLTWILHTLQTLKNTEGLLIGTPGILSSFPKYSFRNTVSIPGPKLSDKHFSWVWSMPWNKPAHKHQPYGVSHISPFSTAKSDVDTKDNVYICTIFTSTNLSSLIDSQHLIVKHLPLVPVYRIYLPIFSDCHGWTGLSARSKQVRLRPRRRGPRRQT